ncbi:MAG: hypothetical protein HUK23_04495, partial [Sphaerochaetaceae bacterium]|nr:hypothetical protein [Sphaerochaetaceae bacterium]
MKLLILGDFYRFYNLYLCFLQKMRIPQYLYKFPEKHNKNYNFDKYIGMKGNRFYNLVDDFTRELCSKTELLKQKIAKRPKGILSMREYKGHYYYSQRLKSTDKYGKALGKNVEMINALAQKEYELKLLAEYEEEIQKLKRFKALALSFKSDETIYDE